MMEYVFLIVAAFLFSVQFLFEKAYQLKEGESSSATFLFVGIWALSGMVFMLFLSKFRLDFTWFSFGLSALYAFLSVTCLYACVKALKNTDMSTFSTFTMLGGMILPFLSGLIFYHEPVTYAVFVCCALIILSLVLEAKAKKGSDKNSLKYCMLVFFLNGACGVLAKTHEYFADFNASSQSYMFFTYAFIVAFSLGYHLVRRKKPVPRKKISVLYCVLYSACATVANFLVLLALKTLPASVNYPFITGGTMFFSTLIGLVFLKEKIKALNIVAVGIAVLAVVLVAVLPV